MPGLTAEKPPTMIRATAVAPSRPSAPRQVSSEPAPSPAPPQAYGRNFWLCYAANLWMVAAASLLYRYFDFVELLGGKEQQLGWIVGAGMIGSLSMRIFQGAGIDRFGPRLVWLVSLLGFIASCLAHPWLTRVDGGAVYFWRIVFQTSMAGVYGASIAYISSRAPAHRLAEVIGTLGTSGFLGILVGNCCGDFLTNHAAWWTRLGAIGAYANGTVVYALFYGAALFAAFSFLCTWAGARNAVRHAQHRRLPIGYVLRKYHPGPLLLVAAAMGFGLNLPPNFVRPFAASLGIDAMMWFFGVYTLTAFGTRIALRRTIDRLGVKPVALAGLAFLLVGTLAFIPISAAWQLSAPAILIGAGHALLFPAVTAGVSVAFPPRHRGLATTLTMAMFDLGGFVVSPLAGGVLHLAEKAGWMPYPAMFVSVAGVLAACALVFAWSGTSRARHMHHRDTESRRTVEEEWS